MRLTFYLQAVLEVERILTCLRKVVAQLSGESVRTNQLADLLTGAGYRSGHVAPRLASELCINFLFQSPQGEPGQRETDQGGTLLGHFRSEMRFIKTQPKAPKAPYEGNL